MERVIAQDWKRVRDNHDRLAELWAAHDPDLLTVGADKPHLGDTDAVVDPWLADVMLLRSFCLGPG